MKHRTEIGLAKRVNAQGPLATTCKFSDNSTFHECFHWTVAHHLAIVLLLAICIRLGFGTATGHCQIRA